jgi:hypothetical protein
MLISNWFATLHSWLISCQVVGSIVIGFELITVCHKFYVTETHIMYFIRRCWFLKCSEEIHYVPVGAGDMWYYVTVDDGWEEVLGCNVKYWTALSGNRTRAPSDRMWTLYHWAMESVHNMGVLVIHYVPVLLSKCQILNCIVRESNPGPRDRMWTLYHWAMESVHNLGVLVSWPPGSGQILCNYSTPPPTSKHPCIPTP